MIEGRARGAVIASQIRRAMPAWTRLLPTVLLPALLRYGSNTAVERHLHRLQRD